MNWARERETRSEVQPLPNAVAGGEGGHAACAAGNQQRFFPLLFAFIFIAVMSPFFALMLFRFVSLPIVCLLFACFSFRLPTTRCPADTARSICRLSPLLEDTVRFSVTISCLLFIIEGGESGAECRQLKERVLALLNMSPPVCLHFFHVRHICCILPCRCRRLSFA